MVLSLDISLGSKILFWRCLDTLFRLTPSVILTLEPFQARKDGRRANPTEACKSGEEDEVYVLEERDVDPESRAGLVFVLMPGDGERRA